MRFHVPFTDRDGPPIRVQIVINEGWGVAAASILVAAVIAAVADLGEHADISYYGTVAQVIPVFLLALMIDMTARLRRDFADVGAKLDRYQDVQDSLGEWVEDLQDAGAPLDEASERLEHTQRILDRHRDEFRAFGQRAAQVVRGYVITAIPGEAAALWALAAGEGNTFSLTLAATSLVAMVLLYARTLGTHFEQD